MSVGTSPTQLPVAGVVIIVQNLGPGNVYLDTTAVTSATGVKLIVGDSYETPHSLIPAGGHLFIVADQAATDVRYMVVG